MYIQKLASAVAVITTFVFALPAHAVISYDDVVTPGIIFGSGNLDGSFTIDRASNVELALRGKLRHGPGGAAQNSFHSNGDGTYTFVKGVAPTQSFPTAEWSFEWSINSNYNGSSSWFLNGLNYELSLDTDPGPGVTATPFDPINDVNPGAGVVYWDHSIGDNTTTDATDTIAADETEYGTLIASKNVAQNSWKPHWFNPGLDPTVEGVYTITLTALDGVTPVASTSIDILVVPEPTTLALTALGFVAVCATRRRRR